MQATTVLFGLLLVASPIRAASQVRVTRDVDYMPGVEYTDKKDRLDIYQPASAKGAPVVVSFYGGALTAGDQSEQTYVGERFTAHGYVTVVVNYRLSPGVSHPAHVEDAAAAVAWVRKNIEKYGGDPSRIFLTGHSAGAYLLTLMLPDPRYLAVYGLKPSDIRGAAPVSSFFYIERKEVAPARPKHVWGADSATWKAASPGSYVRRDVPPLLLLYADGDEAWRREQQTDFAAALRAAGNADVETMMIEGRSHLSVWYEMENGEEATARAILKFFSKVLSRK